MDTARAIERFLNSPALGEGTRKSYRHDVDEFALWLGDRRLALDDVDVRVLTDYAADLGRARPRKGCLTLYVRRPTIRWVQKRAGCSIWPIQGRGAQRRIASP